MACSSCGAENKPGRKFCIACGTPTAAPCPTRGLPVEADVGASPFLQRLDSALEQAKEAV